MGLGRSQILGFSSQSRAQLCFSPLSPGTLGSGMGTWVPGLKGFFSPSFHEH